MIEEGHLMPDHIHMLISIPPKHFVSQVLGFIKGKSSIWIAQPFALEPTQTSQIKHKLDNTNPTGELLLFVSFSMGEKALLNLTQEAKLYGATLVLRGFKDNSYAQTVKALQKIIQEAGQGCIIDPELFSLFAVTTVPTTILSRPFQLNTLERTQTTPPDRVERRLSGVRLGGPIHDRIQGHVSLHYALEQFAKEGDLQNEARSLLEKTGKGGLQ